MTPARTLRPPAALLAMVLLLLATAWPAAGDGLRLRGLSGDSWGESDLGQGTTIVVVWASWSPRSRDIVERVNPLAKRWGSRARVVTVDFQEEAAVVERFLAGKNLAAPVFLDTDGTFSKKYAIATLPGLLILKDGQIAFRGKFPDDPDRVIAEILG